jgi:hypothetical protein
MRNPIRLAVIAAITAGGLTFMSTNSFAADATASAGNGKVSASVGNVALPPGVAGKSLGDEKNIREALGDVVSASVKDKGFSDVADCFVDQDKTRLKQFKEESGDQLTAIADKFKADWKAKYGKEFDFSNTQSNGTFGNVTIMTSEVQNPDQLVGNWPIKQATDVSVGTDGVKGEDKPQLAASKQDIKQTKNEMFGGDVNLEKGRDVAVVAIPSTMGLPAVNCSMIKEHLSGWHFDVPNNITGQQLHDSLVKHLTMIVHDESNWPTDVNSAYGLVGHHIIEAIYGIDGMAKK